MASGTKVSSLYADIGVEDNLDAGLNRAKGKLTGFAGNMTAQFAGLAASLGAAIGGAKVMEGAMQLDRTLSNIRSVTGSTAEASAKLKDELIAIGSDSTKGVQAVADAYYDVAGGVSDTALHMPILNASLKLAEAGQADLAVSTQGLISAMNAYGASADRAGFFSDVYTRAVGMGVGTMDEFVASLAPLGGLAASIGVDFDELGAGMALMTQKGTSAAMSGTQLKAAMTALLNPNEKLIKAYEEMGVASGKALIEQKGLAGALDAIKEAAGGSVDQMAPLLGSVEALQAATVLAGPEFEAYFDKFKEGLDGATESARALQLDSASAQFDKFRSKLEGIGLDIGSKLLPPLTKLLETVVLPLAEKLAEMIGQFADWAAANPELVQTIVAIGGAFAIANPILGGFNNTLGTLSGLVKGGGALLTGLDGLLFKVTGIGMGFMGVVAAAGLASYALSQGIFGQSWNPEPETVRTADPSEQAIIDFRRNNAEQRSNITRAMTTDERNQYAVTGIMPERFRESLEQLGYVFDSAGREIEGAFKDAAGTIRKAGVTQDDPWSLGLDAIEKSAVPKLQETTTLLTGLKDEMITLVPAGIKTGMSEGATSASEFLKQAIGEGVKPSESLESAVKTHILLSESAAALLSKPIEIKVTVSGGGGSIKAVEQRAEGGPYSAFTPTLVGERGPEVVVFPEDGYVIPNHQIKGNGGPQHIYLQLDGRTLHEVVIDQGRITNHRRGAYA